MIPFGDWLRLGAFTLGAALHLFLAVVVLQKKHRETADWPLLAALVLAGFWHAFYAFPLIRGAVTGQESEVPALPDSGQAGSVVALLLVGLALGSALVLCVRAVRRKALDRRIAGLYGMSVAVLLGPLAGGVAGPASGEIAFASLLTPAVFAYSIYRYNAFGLLIGQRVVFAVRFGALLVIYLVAVRAVAKWAGGGPEFDETVVEFVLILAALLISVPLYGWMSRFLFRQSQLYAGFSKRLTEEAARILDLSKRLQFIAEEVGRTFALRRVILATATEPPVRGEFGMGAAGECEHPIGEARELVLRQRADVYHRDRTTSPEMRKLLANCGFNYLFPLWYERSLTGFLLLDTSPRLFLDENETVLLGLTRQISHSIETCRVIEEKIGLERALARQEHLAGLGKVAATIAHEIKNPLSSVKTLAQLMREDPEVRSKYDRDLGYMIDETDRLNRSVLQLLSFSRPVAEQRQDVDLSEMLETLGRMLERQYAGEQINIEVGIEPGLTLRGSNPEIVKQIVLNLALNAAQATEAKGKVRLEAGTQGDGKIRISILDEGPGIPFEIREKVFEPFFTTKQRGTGLGLAIVRKNVRYLGGEIVIESPVAEGRGTRMLVTLSAL